MRSISPYRLPTVGTVVQELKNVHRTAESFGLDESGFALYELLGAVAERGDGKDAVGDGSTVDGVRREQAVQIAELRAWLDARRQDVEPKSALGKALGYMHRQWDRLTLFMRDPLMELTNNEVERDLRTWVLDRKTWLFCGHDESARRTADALTIITTCKKLGIDPRRYIRDTLRKILAGEKNLSALLPENYKASIEQPALGPSELARHAA